MPLPAPFGPDWDSFIANWCIGVEPAENAETVERSFDALSRLWPERLASAAEGARRGILVIAPLVNLGLLLDTCAPLQGFPQVLRRARSGERSAVAELRFAARLIALGIPVTLEPSLDGKVLDTLIEWDGEPIYCEVIAPETSEAMQGAQAEMGALANRVADENSGRRIEILLDRDIDAEVSQQASGVVRGLAVSPAIVEVRNVGKVSVRDTLEYADAGPTIPKDEAIAILGVAHFRQENGVTSVVSVRLPMTDERAKRLISAESHHFSQTQRNLLVIDMTKVPGGIKGWTPLIQRCFQPNQNRRLGGAILYSLAMIGERAESRQTWSAVINPHAYKALPENLIALIVGTDNGDRS